MPEIELRGVTVERTAPGGKTRRILDDVSLTLAPDFIGSLIGPSGSGKTTALRLMNRLTDPTVGEVRCDGAPLATLPLRGLRRRVAMVFNEPHLVGKTVAENLRLAVPDADEQRCAECLGFAGLDASFLPRREVGLSAGEKHRVALARALMGEPEMLMLDEVTSSLDRGTALAIIATLHALRERRPLAILLASHALDHVRALRGECAVLVEGRVVERGAVERIFAQPTSAVTRAFLAGERVGANHE